MATRLPTSLTRKRKVLAQERENLKARLAVVEGELVATDTTCK